MYINISCLSPWQSIKQNHYKFRACHPPPSAHAAPAGRAARVPLIQKLAHVCEERVQQVEGLPQWHAWLGEMAAAFLWQLPACECAGCALSPIKPASCTDRTVSQHRRH